MMKIARNKDTNETIHIDSLLNTGYQPQLSCICCGGEIIAKLGNSATNINGKQPHFSHPPGTDYNIEHYKRNLTESRNNIIHETAKRIVSELKYITIPRLLDFSSMANETILKDLDGNIYENKKISMPEQFLKLKIVKSETEKYFNSYIPDIYAEVEDENNILNKKQFNLAIEIYKTHAVNQEKAEKYRNNNVYSIEINFSHLSKYDIENKNFNLEQKIKYTLADLSKFKLIYFPLDKTQEEYLSEFEQLNSDYITEKNNEIIDRREKKILWALDKETDTFVFYEKAKQNQEYFCPCCDAILKLSDNHYKHTKINQCAIFSENKYADYWYQQQSFLHRLIKYHQTFKIEGYPLKFVSIHKLEEGRERNVLLFTTPKGTLVAFLVNFNPKINIKDDYSSTSHIVLTDFLTYSRKDLSSYPFSSKVILQDFSISYEIDDYATVIHEQEKIKKLREQEKQFFLTHTNKLKQSKSKSAKCCIFCKELLINSQHNNTNDCIVFQKSLPELEKTYQYINNKHILAQNFDSIKNNEINFTSVISPIKNKSNINDKYKEYLFRHDIPIVFKDFIVTLDSCKINSTESISLFVHINAQKFEFSIECVDRYQYFNDSNKNFIITSEEKFNELFVSYTNQTKFLEQVLSTAKDKYLSEHFQNFIINEFNQHLENQYGASILKYEENKQAKIREQERQQKEDLLKKMEREKKIQEDNNKRDEIFLINKAREKEQYELEKAHKKFLLEKQKQDEQKLTEINSNKETKVELIKKIVSTILEKPIEQINFEIAIDKNNVLEYIIANDSLFLNKYHEIRVNVIDFEPEIIYLCRMVVESNTKGKYVKIFNQVNYALVLDENDFLLEKSEITINNFIPIDLFREPRANMNEIKALYQKKIPAISHIKNKI